MSESKEKAAGREHTTQAATDASRVNYTKLEQVLKPIAKVETFVAWKPGPVKPKTGKFDKIPINTAGSELSGWQKSENHLNLHDAVARAIQFANLKAGVGIAFTGEPVAETTKDEDLYLMALDLDGVVLEGCLIPTAQEIIEQVSSYAEISPSGKGVRILAFTSRPFKTARPPKFHVDGVQVSFELFASSGFVTVTGTAILDLPIRVRTKAVQAYVDRWLAGKAKPVERERPVGPDPKANMTEAERQQVVAKLEDAVPYLETETYDDFVSVMKAFACVAPGIGEDEAIRLAEQAADNAPKECQVNNDVDGTNPAAMVLRGGSGGVDDGVGRIMNRAKRRALDIVLRQQGKFILTEEVVRALEFLNQQFPTLGSAVDLVMSERLGGGVR